MSQSPDSLPPINVGHDSAEPEALHGNRAYPVFSTSPTAPLQKPYGWWAEVAPKLEESQREVMPMVIKAYDQMVERQQMEMRALDAEEFSMVLARATANTYLKSRGYSEEDRRSETRQAATVFWKEWDAQVDLIYRCQRTWAEYEQFSEYAVVETAKILRLSVNDIGGEAAEVRDSEWGAANHAIYQEHRRLRDLQHSKDREEYLAGIEQPQAPGPSSNPSPKSTAGSTIPQPATNKPPLMTTLPEATLQRMDFVEPESSTEESFSDPEEPRLSRVPSNRHNEYDMAHRRQLLRARHHERLIAYKRSLQRGEPHGNVRAQRKPQVEELDKLHRHQKRDLTHLPPRSEFEFGYAQDRMREWHQTQNLKMRRLHRQELEELAKAENYSVPSQSYGRKRMRSLEGGIAMSYSKRPRASSPTEEEEMTFLHRKDQPHNSSFSKSLVARLWWLGSALSPKLFNSSPQPPPVQVQPDPSFPPHIPPDRRYKRHSAPAEFRPFNSGPAAGRWSTPSIAVTPASLSNAPTGRGAGRGVGRGNGPSFTGYLAVPSTGAVPSTHTTPSQTPVGRGAARRSGWHLSTPSTKPFKYATQAKKSFISSPAPGFGSSPRRGAGRGAGRAIGRGRAVGLRRRQARGRGRGIFGSSTQGHLSVPTNGSAAPSSSFPTLESSPEPGFPSTPTPAPKNTSKGPTASENTGSKTPLNQSNGPSQTNDNLDDIYVPHSISNYPTFANTPAEAPMDYVDKEQWQKFLDEYEAILHSESEASHSPSGPANAAASASKSPAFMSPFDESDEDNNPGSPFWSVSNGGDGMPDAANFEAPKTHSKTHSKKTPQFGLALTAKPSKTTPKKGPPSGLALSAKPPKNPPKKGPLFELASSVKNPKPGYATPILSGKAASKTPGPQGSISFKKPAGAISSASKLSPPPKPSFSSFLNMSPNSKSVLSSLLNELSGTSKAEKPGNTKNAAPSFPGSTGKPGQSSTPKSALTLPPRAAARKAWIETVLDSMRSSKPTMIGAAEHKTWKMALLKANTSDKVQHLASAFREKHPESVTEFDGKGNPVATLSAQKGGLNGVLPAAGETPLKPPTKKGQKTATVTTLAGKPKPPPVGEMFASVKDRMLKVIELMFRDGEISSFMTCSLQSRHFKEAKNLDEIKKQKKKFEQRYPASATNFDANGDRITTGKRKPLPPRAARTKARMQKILVDLNHPSSKLLPLLAKLGDHVEWRKRWAAADTAHGVQQLMSEFEGKYPEVLVPFDDDSNHRIPPPLGVVAIRRNMQYSLDKNKYVSDHAKAFRDKELDEADSLDRIRRIKSVFEHMHPSWKWDAKNKLVFTSAGKPKALSKEAAADKARLQAVLEHMWRTQKIREISTYEALAKAVEAADTAKSVKDVETSVEKKYPWTRAFYDEQGIPNYPTALEGGALGFGGKSKDKLPHKTTGSSGTDAIVVSSEDEDEDEDEDDDDDDGDVLSLLGSDILSHSSLNKDAYWTTPSVDGNSMFGGSQTSDDDGSEDIAWYPNAAVADEHSEDDDDDDDDDDGSGVSDGDGGSESSSSSSSKGSDVDPWG